MKKEPSKYDFRKPYFYYCPNCNTSEEYKMPELMAQDFENADVEILKRLCVCGYVMQAIRKS